MGLKLKHVVVVSVLAGLVGFGYEIGYGEIDVVRSPRAGALAAGPNRARLIQNLRKAMAAGQLESALGAAEDLGERYPQDATAQLNRGYAFRMAGRDMERFDGWAMLRVIVGQRDLEELGGSTLMNALYMRGWARRGMGEIERSREDFLRLAEGTEASLGIAWGENGERPEMVDGMGSLLAYNLACYWGCAGEVEKSLVYWGVAVERGYLENESIEGWWMVDPDFEDVRDDPRFMEIGERGGG
ncbi:MAG: TPR end-of-group domain-containing protein [Phycisphaerales bacterium]